MMNMKSMLDEGEKGKKKANDKWEHLVPIGWIDQLSFGWVSEIGRMWMMTSVTLHVLDGCILYASFMFSSARVA